MTTCDRYRPGSGVDATPKTPRAGLRRQTHVACLICTSRIHAPLSPRDTAQGLWTGTIRRRRVSTSNARKSVTPPKKAGAVRAAARRRGPRLRRRRGPSRSCPGPSSARARGPMVVACACDFSVGAKPRSPPQVSVSNIDTIDKNEQTKKPLAGAH